MTLSEHAQAVAPSPELVLTFRQHLRECTHCELHTNTGGPIPFTGDINPTYAILGEAPGRTEAERGQCFVGDSGAILKHWLRQAGIDVRQVTFLNSAACWPDKTGTPKQSHLDACRSWVHGQLEFIRPKILITLGVVAFKTVRHPHIWPELKLLHGKPMFYPRLGIPLFCTYDPMSYQRGRSKSYEEKIVSCLRAVAEWDGNYLDEVCAICGGEFYRYDPDNFGYVVCQRHAMRAGALFPEDVGAAT